jgi:hypothetical protein
MLVVSGSYHIYRNGAVSNKLMDVVKNILIFANNFRKKHIPFSFFVKIITLKKTVNFVILPRAFPPVLRLFS